MSGPLFGIVPAGQPLITDPTSTPSPGSFLYRLPTAKPSSHVMVFLLPNTALPDGAAAAIYVARVGDVESAAQSGASPDFRFLGAIGPGKESALFKIGSDADDGIASELVVGVSVESADSISPRLQQLSAGKSPAASLSGSSQPSTIALAQRIIRNAFNFLSSFSGSAGPGGVEVVPLKAFEEWWRKFESRIRADPSFLERQAD
ncbi:uncharacterized protein UV8b_00137 [Ustilaginoidea virens]|uniref:Hikeshi-like domain-containing protein n=1 Tax=Ustilaginoidea virens TaxID=1159556 RepID=A0A8E5HI75_USTVR|nr:uncharacterized protein UV8b_00137 [Ustilaginoidea virens]QUC15896.1 hypothetical protein UV8b_00137 [Ustilaginoidea virens]